MKKILFTAVATLGLTAATMAQTVPSYVPTNGLVGWWPFNGNANDESGNGNNGTVNGSTLTTDRFGNANKAYDFDGIDDWIQVQNDTTLNFSGDISISSWLNADSYDLISMIVSKHSPLCNNNLGTFVYGIWDDGGVGNFKTNFSASPIFTAGSYPNNNASVSVNNWYNFITTYSDNLQILKYYLNGSLVDSINIDFNITTNPFDLYIGKQDCSNTWHFDGTLDDIGIWNRALSQQEISDLYLSCNNNLTISPSVNSLQTGGTANFTATTSDLNSTFTWQSDFGQGFVTLNNYGNYSGANSNSLIISNVQLANHNQPIRAISSNTNCTDTSNVATIQIADTCITNVTIYDTLLTTVTDTLIINTTLSLPAPNNQNTILIYPNPASDHITIDNGNYTAMAGYTIKIENNAGQQVFQSAVNQPQFYIDLSTWSGNGLYFVHLIDPQNNTVTVRKIVLQ